ncbi:hypothetical protein FBZ88_10657 [Nitrospirillum bahiense]|uniref:Uncharacterized protein n=1 Tax=Nitrospirillum amazonense TaxID=28077 RepID=A0A560G125_9PROT|nr:hypothetical protein FBZ88_10657 [Nitrospirillum amazonense]
MGGAPPRHACRGGDASVSGTLSARGWRPSLRRWLDGYAYRVALDPLWFVAAAAVSLGLAWVTVAAHLARIARERPVRALRYE